MPSYQTIIHPDEKSSLLGSKVMGQYPEMMGDRPIIVEHYHDGVRCAYDPEAGHRKRRSGCCARLCKGMLWTIIGVVVTVFFMRHSNMTARLPSFWGVSSPGEVPEASLHCPSAPISYKNGELHYAFDVAADSSPSNFYFSQRYVKTPRAATGVHFIQTAGKVIVQAASNGASDPVTVDLDIKLSHEELADLINIKTEAGGLVVETANFLKIAPGEQPCISIIATISVASSANISSFDIDTVVLPVELQESLQLLSKNIYIHSVAGSISSETTDLNTRKVEIETTSGTISGLYPLADLLSLQTVSGTVDVDISPKGADSENKAPSLLIRTKSGSITANTETSSITDREFNTQVHTISGTVKGTYLLGTCSNINSASGTIDVDFHTAGDLPKRSIIINSVSGSITSSIHDEAYGLATITGNFQSRSGSVTAKFPSAFEGQLRGKSTTGSVDISGEGVRIIKDTPGFAGHNVVAEKGDGESDFGAETLTGGIKITVG